MLPVPEAGQWRHQSIPAHRPAYFPRPADARAVIRRPSYAARPLTPEEAVAELDLLDYDFHLFTARSTGEDSVIYAWATGTGSPRHGRSRTASASCPQR
jgi:Sigma 54 modulation/S30EA ribosomal protein C terminus